MRRASVCDTLANITFVAVGGVQMEHRKTKTGARGAINVDSLHDMEGVQRAGQE